MENSQKAYIERTAGLSPDHIRNEIEQSTSNLWKGTALDVGTGAGGWAQYLVNSTKFEKVIGLDLIDKRKEELKHLEFYEVDLANMKIPLPDNSVDAIFAVEVIEHIENPRNMMREFSRILKKDGYLFMSTPSVDSFRAKLSYFLRGYFPPFSDRDYKGEGHITPVSKFDFNRMCNEVGLKIHQENFNLPGQLPGVSLKWQSLIPFLKGPAWSDTYIAIANKLRC